VWVYGGTNIPKYALDYSDGKSHRSKSEIYISISLVCHSETWGRRGTGIKLTRRLLPTIDFAPLAPISDPVSSILNRPYYLPAGKLG